jgi:hypothetical protein
MPPPQRFEFFASVSTIALHWRHLNAVEPSGPIGHRLIETSILMVVVLPPYVVSQVAVRPGQLK